MAKSFINPYAFVSFKKVTNRKKITDLDNEKTFSGSFDYTIELKTPLIIPNTTSDKFCLDSTVSNSYGIYSYENLDGKLAQDNKYQPIIPGSEIRGCIRNVYEALTNSCYNFNKNDVYFSERMTADKAYKPGILLNTAPGEWSLYSANKYNDKYDENIENYRLNIDDECFDMFEKVYINISENCFDDISKTDNGDEEGYLTIGNKFKDKNVVSVFIKKSNNKMILINKDDENYKRLIASIKSFKDKDDNCTYQRYLDALKNNKTITIYYEIVNGNYRFSPAQVGRILYNTSLNNLVGESSNCNDLLCPACLLFGNIHDSNSISSRVRFSDATINGYNYENAKYVDLISGSPKCSNKYFYARVKNNNDDWDSVSAISGRKFYWHHIPNLKNINEKVKSNSNSKLKSRYYYIDNNDLDGNKFNGKVYFNDLTKNEVLNLYKAISLVDDKHCHKLGHAKPFGFGSCNFNVTSLKCEELDLNEIKSNVLWTIELNDLELEYILDFNALDKYVNGNIIVNYPFNNDSIKDEGFKWFVSNKKNIYPQLLPPLISNSVRKSPVLKGYDIQKVNSNHK